jgi:DNA-directed RNA polymerase alpha subunit
MADDNKKSPEEASNLFHKIMATSVKDNPKPSKQQSNKGNYSLPVKEMELPLKLKSVLEKNGVSTLKQLASYDAIDLLKLKGIGVGSISLIENAVEKYGLRLGDFLR